MKNILIKLNPWWFNNNFSKSKYIERKDYLDKLKLLLEKKEILTITGIRRIGKSTIQKQLINYLINKKKINPKNILFFNFDILTIKEKRENIFSKILEEYLKLNNPKGRIYVFLDEIQNLMNWENQLKIEYDLNDDIKFILTGSNSSILYSKLSKLLTGRILNTQIYNLSFREFLKFNKIKFQNLDYDKIKIFHYFEKYLKFGHFPETALEKDLEINELRINEYLNSILLRDVLELNNIRDSRNIIDLSRFLLNNVSKLFSYNKFSSIIGISKTTLKEYIILLENAFLFSELNEFNYSLKKQLVSNKKIYVNFQDFLFVSFKFSEDRGRMLENLVFIELKRRGKEIYYHKNKKECDFVIKEGLNIVEAIQVCKSLKSGDWSLETKKREIDGLLDACKIYGLSEGLILTEDEEGEEIREVRIERGDLRSGSGDVGSENGENGFEIREVRIRIMPIWKWLLSES